MRKKRMQIPCECGLQTGYPQVYPQEEAGLPLEDLLDVPPFFGDDPADDLDNAPADGVGLDEPRVRAGVGATPQVATKAGVRLPQRPEMREALLVAAARGDVVTSGNDSSHLPTSLHYEDLAIDVRPAADLRAQIRRYRAAGYTVLPEGLPDPDRGGAVAALTPRYATGAHLHISFDPEGRRV